MRYREQNIEGFILLDENVRRRQRAAGSDFGAVVHSRNRFYPTCWYDRKKPQEFESTVAALGIQLLHMEIGLGKLDSCYGSRRFRRTPLGIRRKEQGRQARASRQR